MEIFLVGMPGSGKTTLGKKLAEALNLKFIDLDQEIVNVEGKEIPLIFQEQGESYFRKIEAKALRQVINEKEGFVLATGGGTPCFFDNMNIMNEKGTTLFLNISPKQLAERVLNDNGRERPLLKSQSENEVYDKLEKLASDRIRFYQMAQITLDTENVNFESLVYQLQSLSKN